MSGECFAFDILSEGRTEERDLVSEEIEFLEQNYDSICVEKKEGQYPVISLTLDNPQQPNRRVLLEVSVVAGYPYVPPRVRILLPAGVTPQSEGALTHFEAEELRKEIMEAISPCLPCGAPCIMQIISVVDRVVCNEQKHSHAPAEVELNEVKPVCSTGGDSLKKRDVVKLSILLMHLLNKCCHLKDPESKEEVSSNFQSLIGYLVDDVRVIPRGLRKCSTWKYDYVKRAFGDIVSACMDGDDKLTKWMWAQEECTYTFQHVSAGRYTSDFIEQGLLGSGGFAPVYVCRKKVDGCLYAVKKIAIKRSQAEKALREVRSLASLSHAFVVRYYDAWIEPGCEKELMRYVLDDEDDCDEEKDITSCASTSTASYVAESGHQRSDPNAYSEENDRSLQERYVWSNTEYMDDDDDSDDSSARNEYEDDESAIMDDLQSPMQVVGDYYTLYIQMELCSQQSLRNLIDQCEKDGESFFFSAEGDRIATSILRQLLTVVVHFHRQKIVHRDLKPDNILFEQNCMAGGEVGTIRVADFGLARTLQCPARHNLNDVYPDAGLLQGDVTPKMFHTGGLGSVLYCAPEQEQGEQYGFSVDEYSVGMIALEMWLAVDKQGFRERFNIMTSVSKGEPLPQWFCTKYPRIAEVISGLIERDPGARRSCEEILNEADLPGDSADVVEALGTIRRHGERLSGRVLHCLKQVIMEQSHTHVLVAKETLKAPLSTVMFELVQAANVIGMLHGAIFVPHCDSLIPMNGTLSEMDVPWTIDMCSRVWAMPTQPHLATGHFLSAHSDQHIGSFYSFYYRTRPYAVFATPLCSSGIEGETFLDPLLALLHLISVSELRCKLDIVISHADWMSALHSNAGCAMEYIDRINHASCTIETNESIGPVLQKVSAALKEQNLLSLSPEQFEIVRSFISRLVEVLPLFGKVASNVRVCVDPALRPSETSVNKSFIKHGVFFECRTRDGGQPVAFLCNLENFTNRCGARAANFPLACLNVDLHELGSICDRVRFPQNDLVLFRGVAVRPKEMKSLAHIRSALAVTANLWADNMRACLRVNHDAHKLGKPVKAMGRQMLVHVGHQSATVSFFREAKLRNQPVDITISDVCKTVRRYCSVDQADDLILYFGECENRVHSEEVRRVFSLIKRSLPRVLVVDADVKKIEECIRQFTGESSPLHTCTAATNVNPDGEHLVIPELVEWMKTKVTTYGIVPIFSARDRVLTFAIDQKQLRVARFFDTKQCKPSSRGDNTKRRK